MYLTTGRDGLQNLEVVTVSENDIIQKIARSYPLAFNSKVRLVAFPKYNWKLAICIYLNNVGNRDGTLPFAQENC